MKLKPMRLAALILLMAVGLSACNLPLTPTPYPEPQQKQVTSEPEANTNLSGAKCLVGTWQINALAEYMQDVMPQIMNGAEITINDVSGTLSYTFNEDGSTMGKADDFRINASVKMNGMKLPGEVIVSGVSRGQYQTDEAQGVLNLKNLNSGDLIVSANVAGVPVVSNMPAMDLLTFNPNENGSGSAAYQCIGNNLQLTVDVAGTGQRVLSLLRVGQ